MRIGRIKKWFTAILGGMIAIGCTEQIDTSDRYVFAGETISSYLYKHSDYDEYVKLLKSIPVSPVSKTTLYQLLTARGNYTCFAPNNKAIYEYLESLVKDSLIDTPSWDAFTDTVKYDSIRKVIVYNSLIDAKDDKENVYEVSFFPQTTNAEFPLPNMNNRKLSVMWCDDVQGTIKINGRYEIDERNRDIPAINGVVHQMHQVIAPIDATLSDYLQETMDNQTDGYLVMARAIQAAGLLDTLRAYRDEVYEMKKLKGEIDLVYDSYFQKFMNTPEHRLLGFTIFAETDDFWRSQGIDPKDPDLLKNLTLWILDNHQYSELDNLQADENYKSEKNLLYQWTTYHILPFKLSAGKLSIHENEYGYNWSAPYNLTIPVMDYYTTMGKPRLMKLIETKVSDGVRINRFPITDNARKGTGLEIACEPDKVGTLIECESPMMVGEQVKNGYIYPLSTPISYNDEVRDNLGKERIRFDVASTFPELISNDIRNHGSACPGQTISIPKETDYKYLANLTQDDQNCTTYCNLYHAKFTNLNDDEIKCTGHFDMTFKLPPVPRKSTYEIRYKLLPTFLRGIVQVYFGTDRENLHTPDIPLDMTKFISEYVGYEPDTGIDDYDADVDRALRNQGIMKGCKSVECSDGTERTAYNRDMRRIVVREQMDPDKTYYLRFRSVLEGDTKELCLDYLEFCPKEVYDNPMKPEDIW